MAPEPVQPLPCTRESTIELLELTYFGGGCVADRTLRTATVKLGHQGREGLAQAASPESLDAAIYHAIVTAAGQFGFFSNGATPELEGMEILSHGSWSKVPARGTITLVYNGRRATRTEWHSDTGYALGQAVCAALNALLTEPSPASQIELAALLEGAD